MGVFFQSFPRFQGLEGPVVHWLETEDLDECDEAIHAVLLYLTLKLQVQQVKMKLLRNCCEYPFQDVRRGVCVSTESPVVMDTVRHCFA